MVVILAHPGDLSLVDYQHYVWANMFQFLGAQVATIPLKSVCSTVYCTVNIIVSRIMLIQSLQNRHYD